MLSILNLHLCSFNRCFYWMFFSSIKEINRLINKGMSNIHLRVTIDKNWHSQNFDFLDLNNLSPVQCLRSSSSCKYISIVAIAT